MHLKLDKSKWQKVQFGDVVKKVNNKIDPNEYDSDIVYIDVNISYHFVFSKPRNDNGLPTAPSKPHPALNAR